MLSLYNPSYIHADLPVCNHSSQLPSYSQSLSRPTQGHTRENVQTGVIKANPSNEKFLEPFLTGRREEKKKRKYVQAFRANQQTPVFVMLSGSSLRGERGF